MAIYVARNPERLEFVYGMTLYEYIVYRMKHRGRLPNSRLRKWLERCAKQYLHSKQIFELHHNIPRTVYFVYVMTNERYDGYVKIGYTQSIENRLMDFRVNSPFPEEIQIYTYRPTSNGKILEAILHEKFGKYRKSGEWFCVDKQSVKEELSMWFKSEYDIEILYEEFREK